MNESRHKIFEIFYETLLSNTSIFPPHNICVSNTSDGFTQKSGFRVPEINREKWVDHKFEDDFSSFFSLFDDFSKLVGRIMKAKIVTILCSTHKTYEASKTRNFGYPTTLSLIAKDITHVCDIFVLKCHLSKKNCQSLVTFEIENVLHEYFYLK